MNNIRQLVIGIGLLAAQSALAHTELSATVPADSSMLAEAPKNVQLNFSEPVRLTALSIQPNSAAKQSLGPLPSATTEAFTIALPKLSDGHYVVTWRALSEDTHVMNGEFMFAVGVEGSHDAHADHAATMQHDSAMQHDETMPHDASMPHDGDHAAH